MDTAPPCGSHGHFPEPGLGGPGAKGRSLKGCTPGTADSGFAGKGLSETTAWVRGQVPAWQQAQLPSLKAATRLKPMKATRAGVRLLGSSLSLVGQSLDPEEELRA